MKLLLLVLALAIPLIVGYLIGRARQPEPTDIKHINQELRTLRETHRRLLLEAAKSAVLGDDFAVIALDILQQEETRHE
jgi:hypothetical protein